MRSNLPLVWVVIWRCFLSKKVVESGPTQTLRQEWPNGKLSFSCCIGLPSPSSIERMKAKLFSILYCNVELNFVSAFLLFSLETRNRTPHPTNSSTHWFLNSDEQHCMQIQTVEYLFEEKHSFQTIRWTHWTRSCQIQSWRIRSYHFSAISSSFKKVLWIVIPI